MRRHLQPRQAMGPWRWVILPAAGAVATWTGAALLVWGVVPLLTAEPANASSAAEIAIGTYALATTGALGGSVVVAGLGLTWSKPRWVFGRVLLLIGGVVAALAGSPHDEPARAGSGALLPLQSSRLQRLVGGNGCAVRRPRLRPDILGAYELARGHARRTRTAAHAAVSCLKEVPRHDSRSPARSARWVTIQRSCPAHRDAAGPCRRRAGNDRLRCRPCRSRTSDDGAGAGGEATPRGRPRRRNHRPRRQTCRGDCAGGS